MQRICELCMLPTNIQSNSIHGRSSGLAECTIDACMPRTVYIVHDIIYKYSLYAAHDSVHYSLLIILTQPIILFYHAINLVVNYIIPVL